MKKRSVLSLFVLLVPFLMANSPSPERYPINYNDYELVDESASISQEGTDKIHYFLWRITKHRRWHHQLPAQQFNLSFRGRLL